MQMDKEYWDSCLFLVYLQNKPEERELVDIVSALLRRAESGETLIVVSTFVLVELRSLRPYDADHAEVLWDLFHTNRPYLRMVSLSPRLAELAATIGSEHQITSPDTVHVATAWSEKVSVMLTLDGSPSKEIRRSGGLLQFDDKIGKPALAIKAPSMPLNAQFPLPEEEA